MPQRNMGITAQNDFLSRMGGMPVFKHTLSFFNHGEVRDKPPFRLKDSKICYFVFGFILVFLLVFVKEKREMVL